MEKKIRIIKTYIGDPQNAENEHLSMIREFDVNGNQIFTKEYDEDGKVVFENKLVVAENNRILTEETISYTDDYGEKKTFSYDADGKLISEKIEYDGGWFSIRKYERDAAKRSIRIVSCDEDDEVEEISETEYNEKGDILCHKDYDENNKQKDMIVNTYREDGLLILKEEYKDSKKPEKIHHYYYDDAGQITAVQTLNQTGRPLDWVKLVYDENGKPVEQLMMSGAKITVEYDVDSKTVTETHYNPSGAVTVLTKTMRDEEGNIIEEKNIDSLNRFVYEYF